jgi:hypothetical protein
MSSTAMMKHSCTIQRNVQSNVDGVVQSAWSDLRTSVRCLVQEGAGSLRGNAAGQGLVYDAILFLPSGTNVRPQAGDDNNDRIVMSSPARLAGVVYLVKLAVDESGMEDHIVAYLTRVPAP